MVTRGARFHLNNLALSILIKREKTRKCIVITSDYSKQLNDNIARCDLSGAKTLSDLSQSEVDTVDRNH